MMAWVLLLKVHASGKCYKNLACAEDVFKHNIHLNTPEENRPKAISCLPLRQFVFLKSTENNRAEIYTTGILTNIRKILS